MADPVPLEKLGYQKGQLQRLIGVQARVAIGVIAARQVCLGNGAGAPDAFRDVAARHLDMDAARMRPLTPVDGEEGLHLAQDQVERPRLVAAGRLDRVAVHRIRRPDDAPAFALDGADQPGEVTQGRGTYLIVITEIPYQVQKSRLIERIAELLQNKRLPLLADVRDESTDVVRVVLEPRARTVDATILMESLFKLTDLESRFPLNMNVLSRGIVPKVMPLNLLLREWLDHRRTVLVRRSEFRLEKIRRRLEILGGFLIAYLNLDEVIRIIREEDEPKAVLIATFSLNEVQAEAILNMRLRNLRKLEEMEIRTEHDALVEEQGQIETLVGSEEKQWQTVAWDIGEVRKAFGPDTLLGKRRTTFATAPTHAGSVIEAAMIEREPITVVVSRLGWIRAMKGHLADFSGLTFKTGDELKTAFHAETNDKLLVFSTLGRFYTLGADALPGGKGQGEPIRLMADLSDGEDIVSVFAHRADRKLLLVSTDGRGFVVSEAEVLANTRKGKQIMGVSAPVEARFCVSAAGDHVAIIGENRKLLLFPLSEIPELPRGKGVRLQRYRDGGVADVRVFATASGLTWLDSSGRTFTRSLDELREWIGDRAQAGRLPPSGFPRNNSFGTPPLG